jgi:hypothetical protein
MPLTLVYSDIYRLGLVLTSTSHNALSRCSLMSRKNKKGYGEWHKACMSSCSLSPMNKEVQILDY